MFRRKRSRPRPHATFLLPSLASLSWRKAAPSPAETNDTRALRQDMAAGAVPPYRYSVASQASTSSASSSSSSTATVSAPSLSTSLSTSPDSDSSVLSTPRSMSVFGSIDYRLPASTAEPEHPQDKPSPRAGTSPPGPPVHVRRVLPTMLRCRRCSTDLAFAAQIVSKGFTGRHGRAYLVSGPASHAHHLILPEARGQQDGDDWDDDDEGEGAGWLSGDDEDGDGDGDGDDGGNDSDHSQRSRRSVRSFARGKVRPGGPRDLPNIHIGPAEHRRLVTGAHVVADISCAVCRAKVGWKYIDASCPTQRYKIGKFILEMAMISTYHSWEDQEERGADAADDPLRLPSAASNPLGAVKALNARYRRDRLAAEGEVYADGDEDDPSTVEFDSADEDECEEIFSGTWDASVVARRRAAKRADAGR